MFWARKKTLIKDDRTSIEIAVRGEMKSLRARVFKTKYEVDIENRRLHSGIRICIEDDRIHLIALNRPLGRVMRMRTLEDPSVMFVWLKMNCSRTFVCPQDVISSGNLRGSTTTRDNWEELEFPEVSEIIGPAFMERITMPTVQQSSIT